MLQIKPIYMLLAGGLILGRGRGRRPTPAGGSPARINSGTQGPLPTHASRVQNPRRGRRSVSRNGLRKRHARS